MAKTVRVYKIHLENDWTLVLSDDTDNRGNRIYISIPPTDGDRVDYVDRHGKYNYDYISTGLVTRGVVINIKAGKPKLILVPYNKVTRIYRILRDE